MRRLSTFQNEKAAKTFGAYLYTQGITNEVRPLNEEPWAVWIHAESDLEKAHDLLEQYEKEPNDPKYKAAWDQAQILLKQEQKAQAEELKKHINLRKQLAQRQALRLGRVTLILIAFSVLVAVMTKLGEDHNVVRHFTIVNYKQQGEYISWNLARDLQSGQLWRLVTPIFVHFGFLHLLFNMWWLKDLGSVIENRQSSLFLLVMVLVIAVVSNVAQL
ncbi:MAG: rhomboid family intramembrane serine protease [Myxococcales bacterium]|nr:MAG: rhomboid family intramembrane serine protease [Myxococcales bacterium]